MKTLIVLFLLLSLISTRSWATSDNDVDNFCLDFGSLIGSIVVSKANAEKVNISNVLKNAERTGKKYGTPNFQKWAIKFTTSMVFKVSDMSLSQVNEVYSSSNRDFVKLVAGLKSMCKQQIN